MKRRSPRPERPETQVGRSLRRQALRAVKGGTREAARPRGGDALSASLRMLARRALSEGEVRERLLSRGFEGPGVDAAVARLSELGLLDDAALALRLAGHFRESRRFGPGRIALALRKRRVPDAVVERTLREIASPDEDRTAAVGALEKRFRDGLPPGREGAAKAFRFLRERGFGGHIIREAIGAFGGKCPDGEE